MVDSDEEEEDEKTEEYKEVARIMKRDKEKDSNRSVKYVRQSTEYLCM